MKRTKSLRGIKTDTAADKKRKHRLKVFIYTFALAALGGGGYLLYNAMQKRKEQGDTGDTGNTGNSTPAADNATTHETSSTANRTRSKAKANDDFPLRKGSKGTRVMQLQQALIRKGASIKADGNFGTATQTALKTYGFDTSVDEATFSSITGIAQTARVIFNPAEVARKLYRAADLENVQDAVNVLRQIKTVDEYSAVNEYYKKLGFISKTIVTHLLDLVFNQDDVALDLLRNEFKRIGLKENNRGIWSLQGIQLYKDLITIRPTIVFDSWNNRIPVQSNTILGDEVKIENGMTWFRSVDRTVLRVPTQDVKYTTV